MAGGKNSSLRKYLGSIKDATTINLAKFYSDYKELDIAVVKATNHVERPAKDIYIRDIIISLTCVQPRADVIYCIHALARRLANTHNWVVALKTLVVFHRALREVDITFHEELVIYGQSRSHILNMSHFKDESSASAWDYSAWVRAYALFLEERLECFRVLKYDVERHPTKLKDLDTVDLLEQLPALQQLLYRALSCQPEGAAIHNHMIQLALAMVASESMKIYCAISDGTVNLVDKFFEMQHHDAMKALDIYRKAVKQAERLSEFYEVYKNLDVGRGKKLIKIEQPPASFLQAMEEYVKEAPRRSTFVKEQVKQVVDEKSTIVLVIEDNDFTDLNEELPSAPPEPVENEKSTAEAPDLLSLDEPNTVALGLDEKNTLPLAILSIDDLSTPNLQNGETGWELALVTAPSSIESASATTKLFCAYSPYVRAHMSLVDYLPVYGELSVRMIICKPCKAGEFDKLALDSLYDEAINRNNQPSSYNPWEPAPVTTNQLMPAHDPYFMLQQPTMMGPQHEPPTMNPFGRPNVADPYGHGMPVKAYNPFLELM